MMFEKAKPFNASHGISADGRRPGERARLHGGAGDGRVAGSPTRRAGDALRAMEWSELTARLNAARDLRLLLRTESQAPIEAVAASFGDAAASYFALLDDGQPVVNRDPLGQSKAFDARIAFNDPNRPGEATGPRSDASRGDAKDQ